MDPRPLTPSHTPYDPLQPRLSRHTHTHTSVCRHSSRTPSSPRLVHRPRLFAPLLALSPPPPRTLSLIPSSPPTPLLLCYYSVRAGVEHDTPFTDCSTSTRGTRSRAHESYDRERPGHRPRSMTTDSTAQNVQLQAPRTRSSPRSRASLASQVLPEPRRRPLEPERERLPHLGLGEVRPRSVAVHGAVRVVPRLDGRAALDGEGRERREHAGLDRVEEAVLCRRRSSGSAPAASENFEGETERRREADAPPAHESMNGTPTALKSFAPIGAGWNATTTSTGLGMCELAARCTACAPPQQYLHVGGRAREEEVGFGKVSSRGSCGAKREQRDEVTHPTKPMRA